MSLDCKVGSELIDDGYSLSIGNCIDMFTFSGHGINDYCGTVQIIKTKCDKVYTEQEHNATFDTYEYSRSSIEKLKELDEVNNYGQYFTDFLNKLLESEYNTFYITIF